MISITINGKRLKARKGDTVLRVAERAGIKIPTLCYHKGLTPFGGCRLCIVEVKGWKTPLTACTLNVEDGMVVKTDTPRLRKLRRFTLELILSEHPNACLICERENDCQNFQECIKKSAVTFGCKSCPQNNDCELQDLVREMDIKNIPFEFRYRDLDVERHDPFFDRDYNLCILCGRCIRACSEIRHAHTLQFHHRGPDTLVGTAFDLPHLESGCQFCGACVDVCPTGALRDRFSRYDKPPDRSVKTTCTLCSIGCDIELNISDGKLTCTTPHNDQLCVRGRFGIAPLVNHPKRVTRPMIKKNGQMVEVDWEQALQFVSRRLGEHQNRSAIIFTPQLTSEAITKIYSTADAIGAKLAAAVDPRTFSGGLKLSRIKDHPAFVIINTDMVGDFSVLLLQLRKKFKNRAIFVVIDPVRSQNAGFAEAALNPIPGTEGLLLKTLVDEKKRTCKCGVPVEDIERVKKMLQGRQTYVLYNSGNFRAPDLGKRVKSIPLDSQINVAQITRNGLDADHARIMGEEKTDCLYLIGTAPRLAREYRTIIMQDCFLPEFEVDAFLPAAMFAEESGTVTDIAGKTKRIRKAVEPAGKARSDEWIMQNLARIMKKNLRKPKMHKTPLRKTKNVSKSSKKYPLHAIIRENTYGYRSKPLSSVLKGFERLRYDRYVWLNEKTARKNRLKDGMMAKVISPRNALTLPVKISSEIPDHTVLIYHHPSMGYLTEERVRIECTK